MTKTFTVIFRTCAGKFRYTVQATDIYSANEKVFELIQRGEPLLVENNSKKASFLLPRHIVVFDILRQKK